LPLFRLRVLSRQNLVLSIFTSPSFFFCPSPVPLPRALFFFCTPLFHPIRPTNSKTPPPHSIGRANYPPSTPIFTSVLVLLHGSCPAKLLSSHAKFSPQLLPTLSVISRFTVSPYLSYSVFAGLSFLVKVTFPGILVQTILHLSRFEPLGSNHSFPFLSSFSFLRSPPHPVPPPSHSRDNTESLFFLFPVEGPPPAVPSFCHDRIVSSRSYLSFGLFVLSVKNVSCVAPCDRSRFRPYPSLTLSFSVSFPVLVFPSGLSSLPNPALLAFVFNPLRSPFCAFFSFVFSPLSLNFCLDYAPLPPSRIVDTSIFPSFL